MLTKVLAEECRLRGIDVRVVTPDDGLGRFAGSLQDMGRRVIEWARNGWIADLFLELHTNAGPRGVFVIYPDDLHAQDVDVLTRDELGPRLATRIAVATGLSVWSTGVMSERDTYVGSQGYRLGIFAATAPIRSTTRRLLIECGAHSQPLDLAIIQSPDFPQRLAIAIADTLEHPV